MADDAGASNGRPSAEAESDERTPIEQALDVLLFAPVGLALTARDELPQMVAKGRARVSDHVRIAKVVGKLAVKQGRREAEKVASRAAGLLDELGLVPPRDGGGQESEKQTALAASPRPAKAAAKKQVARASGGHLAIPGYDTLSASQVVQRLAGLSAEELEAVRAHERANRGRRTILTRIDQLQTA